MIDLRRHGVAVLGHVGDDEHTGLGRAALHQFPGHAPLHAATLVVSPVTTKLTKFSSMRRFKKKKKFSSMHNRTD